MRTQIVPHAQLERAETTFWAELLYRGRWLGLIALLAYVIGGRRQARERDGAGESLSGVLRTRSESKARRHGHAADLAFLAAAVTRRRTTLPVIMPTLRRLTAFLTALLLLQLQLLGADRSCDAHAGVADRAHTAAAEMAHGAHDTSPAPLDLCDVERALGDCATMSSCVTALTIPTGTVTVGTHARTSVALPEPVSIHSQPTTGPDVPPPRG